MNLFRLYTTVEFSFVSILLSSDFGDRLFYNHSENCTEVLLWLSFGGCSSSPARSSRLFFPATLNGMKQQKSTWLGAFENNVFLAAYIANDKPCIRILFVPLVKYILPTSGMVHFLIYAVSLRVKSVDIRMPLHGLLVATVLFVNRGSPLKRHNFSSLHQSSKASCGSVESRRPKMKEFGESTT